MINGDDIEAFALDLEIADKIVERAARGVKRERHIMADETLPFIRAYVVMRSMNEETAKLLNEFKQRELDGMAVHDAAN